MPGLRKKNRLVSAYEQPQTTSHYGCHAQTVTVTMTSSRPSSSARRSRRLPSPTLPREQQTRARVRAAAAQLAVELRAGPSRGRSGRRLASASKRARPTCRRPSISNSPTAGGCAGTERRWSACTASTTPQRRMTRRCLTSCTRTQPHCGRTEGKWPRGARCAASPR